MDAARRDRGADRCARRRRAPGSAELADAAGLEQIAEANAFVLNLVDAVPTAAALGLPADGTVEVVRVTPV